MAKTSPPDDRTPAGLGPPGPNPLFLGVMLCVLIGLVAGLTAGDSALLHSNMVFRLAVGGVAFAVSYSVVAAMWFGWHRRTFAKVSIAGAGGEAPDQSAEITARDQEITEFMSKTIKTLEDLNDRLSKLEGG